MHNVIVYLIAMTPAFISMVMVISLVWRKKATPTNIHDDEPTLSTPADPLLLEICRLRLRRSFPPARNHDNG